MAGKVFFIHISAITTKLSRLLFYLNHNEPELISLSKFILSLPGMSVIFRNILVSLVATMQFIAVYGEGKDKYSSVLDSGQWFKLGITSDGVYRIDYSMLKQAGLLNPENPRIFSNSQGQLSYYNNGSASSDLKEIAIEIVAGSDGIFGEGDYLLFYGQGTARWNFNTAKSEYFYTRHNYSDTSFYFITSSPSVGNRIKIATEPTSVPDYYSSESDVLFVHEQEVENLLKSGREWFQPVAQATGVTINPDFRNLVPGEKIKTRIRVAARSPVTTLFRFYESEKVHKQILVQPVNMFAYTGTHAQLTDSGGYFIPASASPQFSIRYYNNGEAASLGWLDYAILQGRSYNIYSTGALFISDQRSVSEGRTTEFSVKVSSTDPYVWDITDPENPSKAALTRSGENVRFKASTSVLRKFVVFSEGKTLLPGTRLRPVRNQDLHGSPPADMLIVTHPQFRSQAEELAGLHYKISGLVSLIASPEEIYNEFSGGTPDIVAIRNFVRYKYINQTGTEKPLKYLLLFGDGSYENRTPPPGNPNYVPTYQSENSNIVVSSFTSDDFYGLLEENEGEAEGTEDIGIGRFPVSDTSQAGIIIRKIRRYMNSDNKGDWKNIICIVADDEDGNSHMTDAEGLSGFLKDTAPDFIMEKIYLDAFRQITTVNGQTYPDAVAAIDNRINNGCLVFNYIGHGSENGLAHESVIMPSQINSWSNNARLPLFITATCEFSRFDDMAMNIATRGMTAKTSAGEKVLLNENGGAIALMSTTRVVYSAPNYFLNKNIYNYMFRTNSLGEPLRLGDIIRLAKNASGTGPNKRNFSLLGDPALQLAYPWHGTVVTDSLNNMPLANGSDTIKALSVVTVSGHVANLQGSVDDELNGILLPVVYDKATTVKTLANDGGLPMKFEMRNNIIFSGKTSIRNGRFKFSFIVPRDIDYSYGKGMISYYAFDNLRDMNGSYSDLVIGGFSETTTTDTTGPRISLYLNDTLFRNGGIAGSDPEILALIEDRSGINKTGAGIGHDITAWLNDNRSKAFILNDYFENDFDNYTKGRVIYGLDELATGSYKLTLKAWDNYNNSSEASILFVVEEDGKFILKNLINYPNPVKEGTKITAEHNRPGTTYTATISILNMSGQVIRVLSSDGITTGYQLQPVEWDGNDSGGKKVAKGLYIYRIILNTGEGESVAASGRMIIL
jgi:hypothetical protein